MATDNENERFASLPGHLLNSNEVDERSAELVSRSEGSAWKEKLVVIVVTTELVPACTSVRHTCQSRFSVVFEWVYGAAQVKTSIHDEADCLNTLFQQDSTREEKNHVRHMGFSASF